MKIKALKSRTLACVIKKHLMEMPLNKIQGCQLAGLDSKNGSANMRQRVESVGMHLTVCSMKRQSDFYDYQEQRGKKVTVIAAGTDCRLKLQPMKKG